jgi:hypothetical protein
VRRFLSELLVLFFAGLLYGIVVAYSVHHNKEALAPGESASPLGGAVVLGIVCGLCAIVTALLSRLFPVGIVGRVFFGILCGAVVIAIFFCTKAPSKDAAGMISVGAGLGLYVGLLESARQQRQRERARDPTS